MKQMVMLEAAEMKMLERGHFVTLTFGNGMEFILAAEARQNGNGHAPRTNPATGPGPDSMPVIPRVKPGQTRRVYTPEFRRRFLAYLEAEHAKGRTYDEVIKAVGLATGMISAWRRGRIKGTDGVVVSPKGNVKCEQCGAWFGAGALANHMARKHKRKAA